jgi:O-antigen/teichoic acid export membrane protein
MATLDFRTETAAQVRDTVIAYAIRLLLGVAIGAIIGRALGPDGRGAYFVIVMIASITMVLGHLSLGQANIAMWASHRAALPATNVLLAPPLGAAAALMGWLAIGALGPALVPVPDAGLLLLALATVPALVTAVHLTTITLLLGRVNVMNHALVASAAAQCAALLLAGLLGWLSPGVVVSIWAACAVLHALILLGALWPHLRRPDLALARRMIVAGAQYHPGTISLLLLLRIDVMILNAMTSTVAVGLYSIAVAVGEVSYAGTDALSVAMLRRQAESEGGPAADLAIRAVRMATIVATLSLAAVCLAAPVVIPLLYGEAFRASVPALLAMAPGILAYAATRPMGPYVLRLGRPRLMSGLSLLAVAVNVALSLALIPRWGIVGCALAVSAGHLTLAAAYVIWFSRSTAVSPLALLPRPADVRALWITVHRVLRSHGVADTLPRVG